MADEMLRIAGRDGEGKAKAVKTDTAGNIGINFASSEIALPMDLQYNSLEDASAIPVKQIRKQLVTTAFPRAVISANSAFYYIDAPANAIGANVRLMIHGITGATFSAGQGVSLQTTLHIPNNNNALAELSVQRSQVAFPQVCIYHPGLNIGDLKGYSLETAPTSIRMTSMPLTHMRLGVRIRVDGTFEATKGVDCEAIISWIY